MMRFAMLASASAMAFVFAIGSVSAADQFTTLEGVRAVPMSSEELRTVKGMNHHFFVLVPESHPRSVPATVQGVSGVSVLDPAANQADGPLVTDGRFGTDWKQEDGAGVGNLVDLGFVNMDGDPILVSPAYRGLRNACGNGTIQGPGFLC